MKTFIFAFSLISSLSYAQIRTASATVGSGNDMTLDVTINDFTGITTFEVSGPSTKWFASAFNTTNMNGYAIVHNNNGGNPVEYTMNGNGAPTLQSTQNLENISSSTSGVVKTFNFTRVNDTGNSDDYTFSTTVSTLNIAYAIGSGPNLAYHGPNRGSSVLTFTNPCTATVNNTLPSLEVCAGETVEVFGNQVSTGTYTDTLWSVIGCDSVINTQVVNMAPFNEITIDTNLCKQPSFNFMGTEITTGGEYRDTSVCDITILNITFQNLEANCNFDNGTLNSQLVFHPTQWYSCDGDSIITGEAGISYTPDVPGDYAVINSFDIGSTQLCIDTSECVTVTALDLNVNQIQPDDIEITIQGKSVIINHNFKSDIQISVLNALGQEVFRSINNTVIDLSNQPNALYLVKIVSGNKTGLFKITI